MTSNNLTPVPAKGQPRRLAVFGTALLLAGSLFGWTAGGARQQRPASGSRGPAGRSSGSLTAPLLRTRPSSIASHRPSSPSARSAWFA